MDWKDLERMTVLKLREEALKYPQIEGVHGKHKEQLMDEIAGILDIEKPHAHFTDNVSHTKSELKNKIHELKSEREKLLQEQRYRLPLSHQLSLLLKEQGIYPCSSS